MSTCVAPCLGGVSACLRIGCCCLRNCKCGCHMQYLQYLCGTTNDTGLISATHTSIELRSPGFIFTHHKIKQNLAIQYALDEVYVQAQVHNRHTVAQIQQQL